MNVMVQLKDQFGWTDDMINADMTQWIAANPGFTPQDKLDHFNELKALGMIDEVSYDAHMSNTYGEGTVPTRHSRLSVRNQLKEMIGAQWDDLSGGDVDRWFLDGVDADGNPFPPGGPTDADVAKFLEGFIEEKAADGTLQPSDPKEKVQDSWEWMNPEDFAVLTTESGDANEKKAADIVIESTGGVSFPDTAGEDAWMGADTGPLEPDPRDEILPQFPEDLGTPSPGGEIPTPAPVPESDARPPDVVTGGSSTFGTTLPGGMGAPAPVATPTPPANQTMITDEDVQLATPGIQRYLAGAGPAVRSINQYDSGDDDYVESPPGTGQMDPGDFATAVPPQATEFPPLPGDEYVEPPPQIYGMSRYQAPESFFAVEEAQLAADREQAVIDTAQEEADYLSALGDIRIPDAAGQSELGRTYTNLAYQDDDWYAGGGIYDDNTAIVGESGPELAVFPVGTEIVPLDRRMKPSQARRLRRRGIRGMQEGGLVFGPQDIPQGQSGDYVGFPGDTSGERFITKDTLAGLGEGRFGIKDDSIFSTDPESALAEQVAGAQESGAHIGKGLPGATPPTFEESLAGVRGGNLGDLPIGIQQILRGRSPRPLAGRLLRQAGMALPSAQAWRNLSPDEQAVYTDLGRRSGISEGYLQRELATSTPSGGGGARRGRMLPLATRRGFRR